MAKATKAEPSGQTKRDLVRRLAAAEAQVCKLADAGGSSVRDRMNLALAESAAWKLRALILQREKQYDPARKASATADELAQLAARLERNTIADRVAKLEAAVQKQGRARGRLQALAHTRRTGSIA
jgi:Asp-tRNA(Asn)/Glu-tRNA(Gln) amidotransferase B subunit